MISKDLITRLEFIQTTMALFVPPDADVVGFVVADGNGRFTLDVSMHDSVDMAQQYREMLNNALAEQKVPYTFVERGRRADDESGEYTFTTEHFVIKAVDFSEYLRNLGLTTVGPTDSEDPEIEAFMARGDNIQGE